MKWLADFHYKYLLLRFTWPGKRNSDLAYELSQATQNTLDKWAGVGPRGRIK